MAQCKYAMREHQISYDDGVTWTSLEVIKGDLIEYQSADCPDSGSEITKWVDLDGDYICEENRKYKKQVLYVSYDGGATWYIYYPTIYQKGEYVGIDDEFCNNKFEGHYEYEYVVHNIDPIKIVKCGDNTTLSQKDITYYNEGSMIGRLLSATIGDCVTRIGSFVFSGCTNLTSVDIRSGLTSIGEGAFVDCTKLTSINIPSGVTSIGESAFRGCSGITSIDIPNSVTSINNAICSGCTSLTNINIPSGVTSIGSDAFYKCTSLTSIVIPDSVTSIGNYAFQQCSGLTSCTIGSGVTSIGSQAFYIYTNPSLISITINAITPPSINSSNVFGYYNCPIYVPSDSVNAYKTAENWTRYANRIQAIP